MLFAGTYMVSLLCAIVPCQPSMRPTDAHIANDGFHTGINESTNLTKLGGIDPVQNYVSNDISLLRNKRLNNETSTTTTESTVGSDRIKLSSRFQRYPNLVNPARTLMDALRRGMDQGSGYTNNFGNSLVPFPNLGRVGGPIGNAKRNVPNEADLAEGGRLKETIVYLRNGDAVEGYHMGTMKGRKIVGFQGIPYAEAPVGRLRFKPPVAKRPWNGLLKATRTGSECIQGHPINMFRISGSEDCLFLNVYTPKTSSSRNKEGMLPVIFFIHGGSFMYGSGSEYGPAYLMDENVVLVTFNYRLGALGFLTTGDLESPGNYGIKDQALALKWVHDNIEQFGGDKNKVTLLGQSAGGVAAHIHMLANKTTHLFQSGISLSGSAHGFWPIVPQQRALGFTKRLARNLRCPQQSSALINCLRGIRPNYIIGAQLHFFTWLPFHPLIVFAPVIEPEGPESYFTKSPQELYATGAVAKKPWIFGQTSQEGHFETYMINLFFQTPIFRMKTKDLLPVVLDYKEFTNEPQTSQLTEKILNFYGAKTDYDFKLMDVISEMYTDRIFTNGIQRSIRTHGQIAPTYSYIFDYMGTSNLGQAFGAAKSEWGVVHTEDLFFLFNSSVFHHGFRKNDPEYKLSEIMTSLVANFAKHGEPLYTNEKDVDMKIWNLAVDQISANRISVNSSSNNPIHYLQLSQAIKMIEDPYVERNQFWKSLGIQL